MKVTQENIMNGVKTKIRMQRDWNDDYSVAIYQIGHKGKAQANPVVMQKMEDGNLIQPCMTVTKEVLQDWFNELWQAGFRPTDGTGNSGHIEAMNRHLEDMRSLVFKKKPPTQQPKE